MLLHILSRPTISTIILEIIFGNYFFVFSENCVPYLKSKSFNIQFCFRYIKRAVNVNRTGYTLVIHLHLGQHLHRWFYSKIKLYKAKQNISL